MMIRIARPVLARQGPFGEDGMLGVVQHQFIFRRAVERGVHRKARFHVHVANGRDVFGARHEQPGNFHGGEGLVRTEGARGAGAEHHGGLDARVSEALSVGWQSLTA